tara:strand:+ start:225 stop:464 length:240 start_codon:yes stop_codon:yes gene_type:complete
MKKRLITENWYKFLKEYQEPIDDFYINDPEEGLAAQKAMEELESLKAQKAIIEKKIKELEMQIDTGMHSVAQIKEDKDG